jgi:hypothetical protein
MENKEILHEIKKNLSSKYLLPTLQISNREFTSKILKELGLSQRYISLVFTRYDDNTGDHHKIQFKGVPLLSKHIGDPNHLFKDAILLPIQEIIITYNIINPHQVKAIQTIQFHESFLMPPFFEKIFGILLKDVYKEFIKTIESIK